MGVWSGLAFVAFTLLCLVIGVTATTVRWRMVDEVNARLDEKDRFDHLGWHYLKARRLLEEYRRLYPEGHLVRQEVILGGALTVVVGAAAWKMGFGLGSLVFLVIGGSILLWLMYRK